MLDVAPTKIIMKKTALFFKAGASVARQTLGVKFGDGKEGGLGNRRRGLERISPPSFQSSGLLQKYPEVLLG